MSCCKDVILKIIKSNNIIKGNLYHLSGIKYEFTDSRIRICQSCDDNTWLTKAEYLQWVRDNGIEVLENLHQLEVMPPLPKYNQDEKRRSLFCRICKCFIPAKARVESEHCKLGKW